MATVVVGLSGIIDNIESRRRWEEDRGNLGNLGKGDMGSCKRLIK